MKIAIITDTHAGIRNSSDIFLNYAEEFYSQTFFPFCAKNGITEILHLGDYFDNRKVLHVKTLHRNRKMFLERLREYGMHMTIIPGNHDVVYKNTNEVCSLVETFANYKDVVTLHMTPAVVDYAGLKIALLPWINAENAESSLAWVRSAPAPILAGHLELSGFKMMKGAPATSHGLDADLFSAYETVLSGHYHTKSSTRNIHYLGVPYEQTWADCNDPKYFHTLDTDTRELRAHRNSAVLFKRIVYDDSSYANPTVDMESVKMPNVKNMFVKIIISSRKDPYAFDKWLDRIIAMNPLEYKIIEDFGEYLHENVSDDDINVSDTVTLLNTYVDAVDTPLDKNRIKQKLQELYIEAQNFESA